LDFDTFFVSVEGLLDLRPVAADRSSSANELVGRRR
jgi:hypothetical protein